MAVLVSTPMEAQQLKNELLRPLEAQMGRVRTEDKHASRTIDLDVIMLDGELLDPSVWQHVHLAVPMAELFPGYLSETGESLQEAARRLAQTTPIHLRDDISIPLS